MVGAPEQPTLLPAASSTSSAQCSSQQGAVSGVGVGQSLGHRVQTGTRLNKEQEWEFFSHLRAAEDAGAQSLG